jgi:hypothetical protein
VNRVAGSITIKVASKSAGTKNEAMSHVFLLFLKLGSGVDTSSSACHLVYGVMFHVFFFFLHPGFGQVYVIAIVAASPE